MRIFPVTVALFTALFALPAFSQEKLVPLKSKSVNEHTRFIEVAEFRAKDIQAEMKNLSEDDKKLFEQASGIYVLRGKDEDFGVVICRKEPLDGAIGMVVVEGIMRPSEYSFSDPSFCKRLAEGSSAIKDAVLKVDSKSNVFVELLEGQERYQLERKILSRIMLPKFLANGIRGEDPKFLAYALQLLMRQVKVNMGRVEDDEAANSVADLAMNGSLDAARVNKLFIPTLQSEIEQLERQLTGLSIKAK